jgi:hypothetical protein
MTQGWVVYGGMRHAEPQREMFSRSYCEQTIPASEAQKRYRRENMRNLDAGDEPEVNPSLLQTR